MSARIGLMRTVAASVLTLMLCFSEGGCDAGRSDSFTAGSFPSFADLSQRITPGIVNISTVTTVKLPGNPFRFFFSQEPRYKDGQLDSFLRDFFGDVPDRELQQRSLGSGVVIDKQGYILTNFHVVRQAEEITIKLTDGREFKAKVIGRDSKTDLSLIKIPSPVRDLPSLTLGNSDKMRVGDWVLAVGNPFGLAHTVTKGIISATGRVIGAGPYDNFLQTDAPINPGNSGGALVNLRGEVIGITTAIVATGQGIGFAIPSNMAKSVIKQLREKGRVIRGWIGVSIQATTQRIATSVGMKEPKGALVGDVVKGGPAETAGMRKGDVILDFNRRAIRTATDLPLAVAETPPGSTVRVIVWRDGREAAIKLKVQELPDEIPSGSAQPIPEHDPQFSPQR